MGVLRLQGGQGRLQLLHTGLVVSEPGGELGDVTGHALALDGEVAPLHLQALHGVGRGAEPGVVGVQGSRQLALGGPDPGQVLPGGACLLAGAGDLRLRFRGALAGLVQGRAGDAGPGRPGAPSRRREAVALPEGTQADVGAPSGGGGRRLADILSDFLSPTHCL